MDKNRSVATLQLVGGHPSLDFANTVAARHGRWGPDVLATYGDLLDWAERTHVLPMSALEALRSLAAQAPAEAAAALAHAKGLREAVYGIVSALAAGDEPSGEDLALLRQAYLAARATQELRGEPPGLAWAWSGPLALDAPTHRIAVEAVALLTGPAAERVKECPGRDCGWLFLDTSRNRSRRWCSDADCGTLDRVTRHRMRARAAGAAKP